MSNKSASPWVAALLLAATATANASDEVAKRGETLHVEHCLRCHDTSVYTREDREIQDQSQLEAQVARCAAGPADVDWDREQIQAVARYLNEAFYGF